MDNVPSSPRVPLEIQEHIVHFLESSSKGTFSAALVCHAWYPSATQRLYNSLEFHDDEQLHRLADLALEHPRVRQHLGFTQIAVFHGPAYSTRFPLALSGLFTTLKILRLHDLTEPLDSGFIQEMSLTFVTKLAITEVQLPRSHSRIEQLVTALRRLEELDIEHLRAETGGSDLEVARLTPTVRSPKVTVKVHCATMAFNVFHAKPMPSALFPMWGMNTVPSFDPPFRKQRSLCIAFMGWLTDVSSCRPTLSLELVRDLPQNCSWSPQREDHDVHVEDVNQVLRKAGPSLYLFKVVYSGKSLSIRIRIIGYLHTMVPQRRRYRCTTSLGIQTSRASTSPCPMEGAGMPSRMLCTI